MNKSRFGRSSVALLQLVTVIAFAALMSGFSGCSTTSQPKTMAQAVYAAHGVYVEALIVKKTYENLPACNPATPQVVVCSKPDIVAKLKVVDEAAYVALQTAQAMVRSSVASQTDVQRALNLANQAIAGFTALTKTLGVT